MLLKQVLRKRLDAISNVDLKIVQVLELWNDPKKPVK